MPQEEKVKPLYKGISERLSKVIACKGSRTVKDFIADVKQYEDLLDRRILKTPVQALSGIPSASPIGETMSKYIKDCSPQGITDVI